jgi:glucose/arabinose dehydrogenase
MPRRMSARRLSIVLAAVLAAAGCGAAAGERPAPPYDPAVESGRAEHFAVESVVDGLVRPSWVGVAPGDERRLWVLEQPGRVLRVVPGRAPEVVLDLRAEVKTGAEQGLLGIAFHPDFARDPRLYLHWSDRRGDTRVAEFRVGTDGRINPQRRRELLYVDQPEENHNGGQLLFAQDGRLHLGLGDGGGAFDQRGAAQDREQLLGKLLSLDVDAPGRPRWRAELYGLRNPWRFWFDQALNDVWIGDVGQDEIEEVHRVPLEPDEPPKNLGWAAYDGVRPLEGGDLDRSGELVFPVAIYTHDDGCSVIGGLIYRGTDLPELSGRYVYGDFCSGIVWTLRPRPDGRAEDVRRERVRVPQLSHIGVDGRGELIFAASTGHVLRAVKSDSGSPVRVP